MEFLKDQKMTHKMTFGLKDIQYCKKMKREEVIFNVY